jgi:hypothetical protein
VGQGRVGVDVEQLGDHDEVLGDTFGVLLGKGSQLVLDPAVDLVAGDTFSNGRFRLARCLRGEPGTTTSVLVSGATTTRLVVPAWTVTRTPPSAGALNRTATRRPSVRPGVTSTVVTTRADTAVTAVGGGPLIAGRSRTG